MMAVSDAQKSSALQRVHMDGVVLEARVVGVGEPVLFVHGTPIADAFGPLLSEPPLADCYQLISYHRRGFMGSTHPDRPLSIGEQAADCLGFLEALGIEQAHVVGHSYGGAIALQLALDAPAVVRSLALLEPALMAVPSSPLLLEAIETLARLYMAGDKAGAVGAFMQATMGPDYRQTLNAAVPGGYDQAVGDADTLFAQELPALQGWQFAREEARRITQPVIALLGAESSALWTGFKEGYELLLECLPRADGFVLPAANHGLQMQNPRGTADLLAAFFARHPISAGYRRILPSNSV